MKSTMTKTCSSLARRPNRTDGLGHRFATRKRQRWMTICSTQAAEHEGDEDPVDTFTA